VLVVAEPAGGGKYVVRVFDRGAEILRFEGVERVEVDGWEWQLVAPVAVEAHSVVRGRNYVRVETARAVAGELVSRLAAELARVVPEAVRQAVREMFTPRW
jgi:hypothetical protein